MVIVADKEGRKIFPSIITYLDNEGSFFILSWKSNLFRLHPLYYPFFMRRNFIGRNLEDDELKEYAAAHSFKVVPINSSISNHSRVGFEIPTLPHKKIVSPEQVGADVLRHLLKVTADFLGHNQVNKAVIAVPAKFDANQVCSLCCMVLIVDLLFHFVQCPMFNVEKGNWRSILTSRFEGGPRH